MIFEQLKHFHYNKHPRVDESRRSIAVKKQKIHVYCIMKNTILILGVSLFLAGSTGCLVSKKKFDEETARALKLAQAKAECEESLSAANAIIEELNKKMADLEQQISRLQDQNLGEQEKVKLLKKSNDDLNKLYEDLRKQKEQLLSSSASEKERLSLALAEKESELNKKAAELRSLEAALKEKEDRNEKLSRELAEREKRVRELESLIARKDSVVKALKDNISRALTGFKDNELTVSIKDGKVYVSLSDKLLFQTGSFSVDAKGKQAIVKIAEVLNKQSDFSIMVEGHTDNKAYLASSGQIKNNWDLSVMRASSVSEILEKEGKVDMRRVIAAGRGPLYPVADNATEEGRSKNRRIEIILSPDIQKIFDILDSVK
jgi:chemotaxis protein MotB